MKSHKYRGSDHYWIYSHKTSLNNMKSHKYRGSDHYWIYSHKTSLNNMKSHKYRGSDHYWIYSHKTMRIDFLGKFSWFFLLQLFVIKKTPRHIRLRGMLKVFRYKLVPLFDSFVFVLLKLQTNGPFVVRFWFYKMHSSTGIKNIKKTIIQAWR
jgi:hypothetical protein